MFFAIFISSFLRLFGGTEDNPVFVVGSDWED